MRIGLWFTMILVCAGLAPRAESADLRIAVGSEATTLDPHFYNLTPNTELHTHLYSALLGRDGNFGLTPDLAESWRALDETHWELKLRRGVTFHDGSPFSADDVIFTYERARTVPNSPVNGAMEPSVANMPKPRFRRRSNRRPSRLISARMSSRGA